VLAAKEVCDLRARLADASSTGGEDVKRLEAAFVKVAKKFARTGASATALGAMPACQQQSGSEQGVARTRG
jgi:hypothetical protein